uniref:Integrase catalytic domain-containing protein n=1 Tax=Tetradesmus obliquus TaxID=3088 RepID=A0A383VEJ4_TETOB
MNELSLTAGLRVQFGKVHHSEWKRHVESHADAKGWLSALTTADDPNSGKVLYLIQTSLDSQTTALIISCRSAKDLYDKLNAMYQSSSIAQTQQLTKAFVNAEQQPGEKVEGWGARLGMCQADLAAARAPVTDAQVAKIFLAGLLPMFDIPKSHFINAEQLPSVIDMLPKLMEWQSLKERTTDEPQAQAYFTPSSSGSYAARSSSSSFGHVARRSSSPFRHSGRSSSSSHQRSSSSSSSRPHSKSDGHAPRLCLYCHKPGHDIAVCRSCIAAEQRKGSSSSSSRPKHVHFNRHADNTSSRPSTPKGGSRKKSQKPVLWMAAAHPVGSIDEWFVDTACTWSVTGYESLIENPTPSSMEITLGDGSTVNFTLKDLCKGDVTLIDTPGNRKTVLRNVHYVPGFTANLLSFSAIAKAGAYIQSSPYSSQLHIFQDDDLIITAEEHPATGIPFFHRRIAASKSISFAAAASKVTAETWHNRFGHLGYDNMAKLVAEDMVKGINLTPEDFAAADSACDACAVGKFTRGPFRTSANKTSSPLQLLHSDICGPIRIPSPGKARFFITLVDDYTSYSCMRPLQHKSEAALFIENHITLLENQTSLHVKAFRSDNGREYANSTLESYLASKGIIYQPSMAYTPEQNGVAERINRTLLSKAIPMLEASGLEPRYWAETLMASNYVRVRSPVAGKPLTPYEALFNVKPNVSHLATFGCQAHYSVPRILRNNKFSPPAARAIMVGYAAQGKGYRLLTDNGSILERASVTFNEKHFPAKKSSSSSSRSSYRSLLLPNLRDILAEEPSSVPLTPAPAAAPAPEPAAAAAPEPSGPAYSTRSRIKTALTATALAPEPQNYKEATSRPDAPLWVDAMDTEIQGIRSNGTWVLGFPPPGTKVLDTKWTFKLKRNSDGSTERRKARVVAKGFQQQEGRDYFEIFTPVGKYTSMRALTAKAAAEDLIIHNIDFSSAFLNGTLEEEVWIKQPEGYVEGEPGMACKLVKSLYGLKQAPRAWHLNLDKIIQEKGFKPSEADPCLYYHTGSEYHPETYLLVYVDDVAIYTKSQESANALISYFSSKYKLRDLGAAELFLGISITRQPTGIKLAQERMINDLVAKYGMENSNGRLLPMSPGTKLTKDEDSEPLDTSKYPYATLVGALLYLANCTRPDIAYPVGVLARFMANPGMSHWHAAKGVLRYLAGTSTYGLNYSKAGSSSTLIGYTDSDFAGDADTRRSTAGFTFIKGNAAICWQSKRQPTVATSTTEAEYMGAATSVKEALWLGVLHRDIGYNITTVEIKADNQSALAILHNPVTSGRAKHIDVAYHFARERVQRGDVSFSYISTNEMTADIMTKALPAPKFEYCRRQMGVF